MPSITRRRLLGGGAAVAVGAYGAHRLDRGATDATFDAWTPDPGTWPLSRYDPANTAHNPAASPPRESPTAREFGAVPTAARRPRFVPLVGPDHLVAYGSGFAAYPRGGGESTREREAVTPLAGFGPDGRLHAVRRDPAAADASAALVAHAAADLHETDRVPLDADDPVAVTVGTREVYVGTESGRLHGVDADGGRRWRVDGAKPALAGGRLYAADAPLDGAVAYAERSGIDRRRRVGPERNWAGGPVDGFPHTPAVANGRFVVGSVAEDGGVVAALDADSGERLWEPRPLGVDVSTPAVVGDRGYAVVGTAGRDDGLVVALDLATGATRWRDEVPWHPTVPAVGGETLVVGGETRDGSGGGRTGGRVRAYDRVSGDVLWTHAVEAPVDGLALVEDRVLVTAGATVFELA